MFEEGISQVVEVIIEVAGSETELGYRLQISLILGCRDEVVNTVVGR